MGDPQDPVIRKLLKSRTKFEARAWLKGHNKTVKRNIGEMSDEDSIRLVQEYYDLGAREVIAVEIKTNKPYESTDTLILVLPDDESSRARMFNFVGEQAQKMGFEAEEDSGQSHLLVWFD